MVKRQTVWLSTMMVLSLMLIGYYTMNSGTTTTTTSGGSGPSITTTTQGGGATQDNGGSTSKPSSQSGQDTSKGTSSKATSQPASGTDWFTNYQTHVEQTITAKEAAATQILANSNSSTQQLSQAQQEMRQETALMGAISQARDAVIGEGYSNCVIAPDANGTDVQVYVQAKTLTASQAVKVMNIVSQQLNVPINSVIVHKHP